MARKAEKTVAHGKAKGVKARSGQHTRSASHSSGTSSVKGSSKGTSKSSGFGSLGKTSLKGCLPTSLLAIVLVIAAIIIF